MAPDSRAPAMKKLYAVLFAAIVALGLTAAGFMVASGDGKEKEFKAKLTGFQETPAISTTGSGTFKARLSEDGTSLSFTLTYSGLETNALFAHIHLGQKGVAGGVSAFLCGGGGKPDCPARSGTVTGTITASDVIGPTGQGIAAGEFAELIRAMRAGVTYANVHSTMFPAGEIRGQIKDD